MQDETPGRTYLIGIVGESFYQDAIASVKVGDRVDFRPEPQNPHDENAVAVVTEGGTVIGYVRRDTRLQDAVALEGATPRAIVSAVGRSEAGHLGVELEVTFGGNGVSLPTEQTVKSTSKAAEPDQVDTGADSVASSIASMIAWTGVFVGVMALVIFVGYRMTSGSTSDLINEAKKTIAAAMRDPASVEFRDVELCPTGTAVNGEYNAKNAYGAFVGFQEFIYADYKYWLASGDGYGDFDELMRRCYGDNAVSNAETELDGALGISNAVEALPAASEEPPSFDDLEPAEPEFIESYEPDATEADNFDDVEVQQVGNSE